MKTNVNMVRKMGEFEVSQRTKDGMFNATSLLKQWNKESGQKKMMSHFLENNSTKDYIEAIENDINLSQRNSVIMKSRANKGKNAGTWMHPYLFIDFAMWLNPTFKLQVVKFVYDQLIELRHNAGDNYNQLTSAVKRLDNQDYVQVAIALNYIVFGRHEKGLRQTASQSELENLTALQQKFAFAINMGYITSFNQLMDEMRRMWHMKNQSLI